MIEREGDPQIVVFENGVWNHLQSNIVIFDDEFVNQNIHSGLSNEAGHRQALHEWILGSEGVDIERRLQHLVSQIEVHISELRTKGNAIPVVERHGYTVDDFCNLPSRPDIDEEIRASEQSLQAALQQEDIRHTPVFVSLNLPSMDLMAIEALLNSDLSSLEAASVVRLQSHFASLGQDSEEWAGRGMNFLADGTADADGVTCPFCSQDLADSPLIDHYRSYFSEEYENLKLEITEALQEFTHNHRGEVTAAFERDVRLLGERRQFWGRFFDIPELSVDTAPLAEDWQNAKVAIVRMLTAKQSAPLERIPLTVEARNAVERYRARLQLIASLNVLLEEANNAIPVVKEQAEEGNPSAIQRHLEGLRAVKARHTTLVNASCESYMAEKAAKTTTEQQRDAARVELDHYRTSVFPGYEIAINAYLQRFNAGFRVERVVPANTRGGSACTYSAIIDNTAVQISGGEPSAGQPSFRNTLSAGDRSTLALAFFFASLDQDRDLSNKIVVIDDPFTSLDEHRSFTTVQEMRRLAECTEQVILMSHTKSFLLRVWSGADPIFRSALVIVRSGDSSNLSEWNVDDDSITDHDRRHAMLREYLASGPPASKEVAIAVRPLLEAYLRVACPRTFPPGRLLGPFLEVCRQRVDMEDEILKASDIQELEDLTEYANKFHHDTNPAWETETINDGELRSFVQRAISFAGP